MDDGGRPGRSGHEPLGYDHDHDDHHAEPARLPLLGTGNSVRERRPSNTVHASSSGSGRTSRRVSAAAEAVDALKHFRSGIDRTASPIATRTSIDRRSLEGGREGLAVYANASEVHPAYGYGQEHRARSPASWAQTQVQGQGAGSIHAGAAILAGAGRISPMPDGYNAGAAGPSHARTRLLADVVQDEEDDDDDDEAHHGRPTPLPYAKILSLSVSRISEGLIYSVILPYINECIHRMGVPEADVGVWSATAESALMATEAITAPFFGPLADRYGRRPVFLTCVCLWGCGAVAFGCMTTLWSVIATRAFLGLLSGAGVLSRTMVGELSDKSNRVQAFSIFSPALTVGLTLGPMIGGSLSNPVPRLLGPGWTLFVNYPYLLPSIIAGSSGLLAFALGVALVPETLPPSLRRTGRMKERQGGGLEIHLNDAGHRDEDHDDAREREYSYKPTSGDLSTHAEMDLDRNYAEAPPTPSPGLWTLLKYKPFQNVLILYGLMSALQFSFEAVFPLFAFTHSDLGGLGLTTQTIGFILALSALMSIVMTLFLFPILHRLIPNEYYLVFCLSAWPVAVITFPFLWSAVAADADADADAASTPVQADGGGRNMSGYTIGLLALHMFLRRIGDFSGTLLDTVIMDSIPTPAFLAHANSATFSIGATGRALGPFVISYFFSLSTHFASGTFGRQLVWIVFVILNVPGVYIAWTTRTRRDRASLALAKRSKTRRKVSTERNHQGDGDGEERIELLARSA